MPRTAHLVHQVFRRIRLWIRRHQLLVRKVLMGLAVFLLVVVAAQLLYPAGRLLPSVEVAGQHVGGQSTVAASRELARAYDKATIAVKTDKKTFTRRLAEVGIDVDTWSAARAAARYTLIERLIPFSSAAIMLHRDTPMHARFDDERLRYFGQQVEKEGFVPAVSASVTVTDGRARLVPAQPSKAYPVAQVSKALKGSDFSPVTVTRLSPKTAQASRTDNEVKGVLGEAQKAVNTPLTLALGNEKIPVSKAVIGSWLDFPEDPGTMSLRLGLKTETVKKYLDSIQGKIYKAPGTTKVQLIDGREVGRTTGEPGRGIDADKTVAALDSTLKKGKETTLTVPIAELPVKVVYDRQYSNGDAGLTALLADLASSRGFGISVMELGGRSANTNGNKRFVAASTYKLFVAYALFKEIEAGRMSWADSIYGGKNTDSCFYAMIHNSDNPCAKAFGDKIGWQNIENQMHALGLTSTELSPSLYTTANDLALFLYRLENGSLVSGADRAKLIDVMKGQIYRAGIPAGTKLAVADKVGFIDSYIHDAGIVYGARGTYVLVIMTSGSSWGQIADAAAQINTFLNR